MHLDQYADRHEWVGDDRITTVLVAADSVRLQSDGGSELRLGAPFVFVGADDGRCTIDPDDSPSAAPLLALTGVRIVRLTIRPTGELTMSSRPVAACVSS